MSTFDLTYAIDRLKLCAELSERYHTLVVCAYYPWSSPEIALRLLDRLPDGITEYIESRVSQKGVTRVRAGADALSCDSPLHMLRQAWPVDARFTLGTYIDLSRVFRLAVDHGVDTTITLNEVPDGDLFKESTLDSYDIQEEELEGVIGPMLTSILRLFDKLYPMNHQRQIDVQSGYALGDSDRIDVWHNDDTIRRRLAAHLLTKEGVLIDMATMHNRPWKGMKFFHGTDYKTLQERGTGTRCNLTWADNHSAFTSPYYHKTFVYGKITYTYRLKVDGRSLRMIDMRPDRLRIEGEYVMDDLHNGYEHIHELSGIGYVGRDRTDAATQLRYLFRDADVDGIIFNNDVEWVWMHPERVLQWDPECILYKLSQEQLPVPRAYVNGMGQRFPPTTPVDVRVTRLRELTKGNIEALAMLLHTLPVFSASYPDLVIQRTALESSSTDAFTSQFVGSTSHALWRPYKASITSNRMYRIDYRVLMSTLWGGQFLDMFLGNTVTERKISTFYDQLEEMLRELGATLLVELPSGAEQVIPRIDPKPLTPYIPPSVYSPRVRPTMRGFVGEERASNRQRLENTMGRLRL